MSRHVAGKEAAASKQVQVLLRPTGGLLCSTQFEDQYPELDPGLRLGPIFFLEPRGGGPGLPRGARMRLPGLRGLFQRM